MSNETPAEVLALFPELSQALAILRRDDEHGLYDLLCNLRARLTRALAAGEVAPAAWRIRVGASNVWGYCEHEWQADFHGKAAGIKFIKEPLYTAPPADPAKASGSAPGLLSEDDVQWIVNDLAELGVMIRGQAFFLYKGDSLVYADAKHEDGRPMHYRTVGKREFGECCHPINHKDYSLKGTVSLDDSDRWQLLPPAPATPPDSAPASAPEVTDSMVKRGVAAWYASTFTGGGGVHSRIAEVLTAALQHQEGKSHE